MEVQRLRVIADSVVGALSSEAAALAMQCMGQSEIATDSPASTRCSWAGGMNLSSVDGLSDAALRFDEGAVELGPRTSRFPA